MTKHGMCESPIYAIWQAMVQRCRNKNNNQYKDYGGRGVRISKEWEKSFEKFYADMGPRLVSSLTLERRDNDKGYFAENCYWATRTKQSRNTRIPSDNKTGVKGVYWHRRAGKYRANIAVDGKQIHLGLFKTIEEAAEARRQGEIKYW